MIKKLFIVAIASVFVKSSQAQNMVPLQEVNLSELVVTLQPRIGLSFATTSDPENEYRVGGVFGIDAEVKASKNIGISIGAAYSMQGCKDEMIYDGIKYDATLKTDYIIFPITLNTYIYKALAFKVGLQPAINVVSRIEISNAYNSVSLNAKKLGVKINDFDFSVPVGLSFETNGVVFDARYNIPLTRIMEKYDDKNCVFQLMIGYKFNI